MQRFRSFFKKNFQKKIFQVFLFSVESGKVIFQSYRAWKAHFGCLESVFKDFHEYILGIFRKLWAFWALDIAPTSDVPVLLTVITAGPTKQFSSIFVAFSIWPFFVSFSISLPTAGCKWIGIGIAVSALRLVLIGCLLLFLLLFCFRGIVFWFFLRIGDVRIFLDVLNFCVWFCNI